MPSLETFLREDTHIIRIEPAESWPIPAIDYGRFRENWSYAKTRVTQILDDLQCPYLIDDFPSHEQRRRWRLLAAKQHGNTVWEFLSHNGLRTAVLNSMVQAVYSLHKKHLPADAEFTVRVQAVLDWRPTSDRYDPLSTDEKLMFAKTLKCRVYDAMLALRLRNSP